MGDFFLSAKSRSGSRIVGLSPTRGSLAIVVDCQHLWRSLEKVGMLGSAAESAWIGSWKDQSFSSCSIHVSFRNLVLFWNVALYPGWIGVYVGALYPGWIGA